MDERTSDRDNDSVGDSPSARSVAPAGRASVSGSVPGRASVPEESRAAAPADASLPRGSAVYRASTGSPDQAAPPRIPAPRAGQSRRTWQGLFDPEPDPEEWVQPEPEPIDAPPPSSTLLPRRTARSGADAPWAAFAQTPLDGDQPSRWDAFGESSGEAVSAPPMSTPVSPAPVTAGLREFTEPRAPFEPAPIVPLPVPPAAAPLPELASAPVSPAAEPPAQTGDYRVRATARVPLASLGAPSSDDVDLPAADAYPGARPAWTGSEAAVSAPPAEDPRQIGHPSPAAGRASVPTPAVDAYSLPLASPVAPDAPLASEAYSARYSAALATDVATSKPALDDAYPTPYSAAIAPDVDVSSRTAFGSAGYANPFIVAPPAALEPPEPPPSPVDPPSPVEPPPLPPMPDPTPFPPNRPDPDSEPEPYPAPIPQPVPVPHPPAPEPPPAPSPPGPPPTPDPDPVPPGPDPMPPGPGPIPPGPGPIPVPPFPPSPQSYSATNMGIGRSLGRRDDEDLDRPMSTPRAVGPVGGAGPEAEPRGPHTPYSNEDWRSTVRGPAVAAVESAGTIYRQAGDSSDDEDEDDDEPISLAQRVLRAGVIVALLAIFVVAFIYGPAISAWFNG